MKRRSFLGLLSATALTPIAVLKAPSFASLPESVISENVMQAIGNAYARQLAAALCETEQIVAGRVLDRAVNEIWWSYPDRSAVFEWLDHGAVLERPVDHWECAGHGDYRPMYYPSQGHTFDPDYARSLFPPAIEYDVTYRRGPLFGRGLVEHLQTATRDATTVLKTILKEHA